MLLHNLMANGRLTRIFVALLLLDFIIDMLLLQRIDAIVHIRIGHICIHVLVQQVVVIVDGVAAYCEIRIIYWNQNRLYPT